MGLFRKKETTHFERDEEGRVVQVTRNGRTEVAEGYELVGRNGEKVKIHHDPMIDRMKSTRQLEQEYYTKHPERRHPTLTKIGHGMAKVDKKIVEYNRTRNIMYRKQPIQHGGYSPRNNFNPFGSLFDTGMPNMPRKKKKPKIQYKVIGGKAYPIASTMPKKKTKKKKSTRRRIQGFGPDPFKSWRW